ncbi:hypothetical protein JTE90_029080 [Oedothorax gibbosus]|uniref:Uncharacterized protein n=1 Tax=Oedothorax gibbosus TaxID=931172 RepID=A0AAV6UXG0_9ARAC|nr:hypothetical protein JTE90_029080 [Oedothorax gibbosus]
MTNHTQPQHGPESRTTIFRIHPSSPIFQIASAIDSAAPHSLYHNAPPHTALKGHPLKVRGGRALYYLEEVSYKMFMWSEDMGGRWCGRHLFSSSGRGVSSICKQG